MSDSASMLGEQLVSAGLLPRPYLSFALNAQRVQGGYLTDVLLSLQLVSEKDLLSFLGSRSKLEFITTEELTSLKALDDALLESFPVRLAERLDVLPLQFDPERKRLTIAVPDPQSLTHLEELRKPMGAESVRVLLANRASIKAGIRRFYYRDSYAFAALDGRATTVPEAARTRTPAIELAQVEEPKKERTQAADPQRELQLLRVANTLQRHLLGERDLLQLSHRVLAFAFDNLAADEGVFLWRDDATGMFEPHAVRSRVGAPSDVQISETLLRELLGTQKSVLTFDAARDSRFGSSETVAGARLRSAIGVPVMVGRTVRGAILLVARTQASNFQQTDLEVLEAIAAQTGLSIEVAELTQKMTAEAALRERLARFMSPALVELVSSGKLQVGEAGVQQEVTVLFADIRGFTSLSERLEPPDVVALLNEHFEAMVELVFQFGGTLDKFVGDALMAIWGAPIKRPAEEARAIRCALAMVERVREMNERRTAAGQTPLQVGIGLNTGSVVFGAMGATRRMDLTVVGDAVNVAARLCDGAAPGTVVVSANTLSACRDAFEVEALPIALLKGKQQAVQTFRVKGAKTPLPSASGVG